MAIAYDSVCPDTGAAGNPASLTSTNWTVASGSNMAMFGFVGASTGGATPALSMKWRGSGGTSLTQIGSTLAFGTYSRIAAFQLVAPTAATDTTYAGLTNTPDEAGVGAISYSGVDQTTPNGTSSTNSGTGSGTTFTPTITVSTTSGDKVLAGFWVLHYSGLASTPTCSTGGTVRYDLAYTITGFESLVAVEQTATGVSTTISLSATGSASNGYEWGVIAYVITPAAAGGSGGWLNRGYWWSQTYGNLAR